MFIQNDVPRKLQLLHDCYFQTRELKQAVSEAFPFGSPEHDDEHTEIHKLFRVHCAYDTRVSPSSGHFERGLRLLYDVCPQHNLRVDPTRLTDARSFELNGAYIVEQILRRLLFDDQTFVAARVLYEHHRASRGPFVAPAEQPWVDFLSRILPHPEDMSPPPIGMVQRLADEVVSGTVKLPGSLSRGTFANYLTQYAGKITHDAVVPSRPGLYEQYGMYVLDSVELKDHDMIRELLIAKYQLATNVRSWITVRDLFSGEVIGRSIHDTENMVSSAFENLRVKHKGDQRLKELMWPSHLYS